MHLLTNYDFVTDRWTFTVKYLQDKCFHWYCRMKANEFDLATKREEKKSEFIILYLKCTNTHSANVNANIPLRSFTFCIIFFSGFIFPLNNRNNVLFCMFLPEGVLAIELILLLQFKFKLISSSFYRWRLMFSLCDEMKSHRNCDDIFLNFNSISNCQVF